MPAYTDDPRLLAGGTDGPAALRPLVSVVLDALAAGAGQRCGPLPRGGPGAVAARVAEVLDGAGRSAGASGGVPVGVLPEWGTGAEEALRTLVGVVAEGAADPADPLCAAHLHCPPLAVAAAADLAASAVNPSMDSWDQAPAASEVEARTCRVLASLVFGGRAGCAVGAEVPDALVTTGGTESNQLGVLLARERWGRGVRVVCGANAHHSVHRAAWLLGLEPPVVVPTPEGVLAPEALREALVSLTRAVPGPRGSDAGGSDAGGSDAGGSAAAGERGGGRAGARGVPVLVVATAGTTDTGALDPLPRLAAVAREFGAGLHVDAAYGGLLLFSEGLRARLAGLELADSVSLDLHKLGWQPVAAGLFAVPDRRALAPLDHRADYLNADDDTEAGLPDLLGRSLRTTRRPDVLKVAVTLRALGRRGMASLVEDVCAAADRLAAAVAADPGLELYARPELTTVLFRPAGADDATVAEVRRRLLAEGRAVLGRARVAGGGRGGWGVRDGGAGVREDAWEGRGTVRQGVGGTGGGGEAAEAGREGGELWLKATLLNPRVRSSDMAGLLKLVQDAVPAASGCAGSRPASVSDPRPISPVRSRHT